MDVIQIGFDWLESSGVKMFNNCTFWKPEDIIIIITVSYHDIHHKYYRSMGHLVGICCFLSVQFFKTINFQYSLIDLINDKYQRKYLQIINWTHIRNHKTKKLRKHELQ